MHVCVCVNATHTHARPPTTNSYNQFLKTGLPVMPSSTSTKCQPGRHYQTAWTSLKSLDFIEVSKTFSRFLRLRKASPHSCFQEETQRENVHQEYLWGLSVVKQLLIAVMIPHWVASRSPLTEGRGRPFVWPEYLASSPSDVEYFWLWGCTTLDNLEDDRLPQHTLD